MFSTGCTPSSSELYPANCLALLSRVCLAVLLHNACGQLIANCRYWTILQPPVQQRLVETLGSVVNDLLAEIRTPHTALLPALVAVANGNSAGAGSSVLASDKAKGPLSPWLTPAVAAAAAREQPRLAALLRNGYKALVFLFSIAVALAERGYSERAAAAAALSGGRGGRGGAAAPGKGKGKGKGGKAGAAKGKAGAKGRAKAAAVDDDDDAADDGNGAGAGAEGDNDKEGAEEAEVFDWPSLRGDCLEVLLRAIAVDPRAIWPASSPEEVRTIYAYTILTLYINTYEFVSVCGRWRSHLRRPKDGYPRNFPAPLACPAFALRPILSCLVRLTRPPFTHCARSTLVTGLHGERAEDSQPGAAVALRCQGQGIAPHCRHAVLAGCRSLPCAGSISCVIPGSGPHDARSHARSQR